jgi:hypothetical protein
MAFDWSYVRMFDSLVTGFFKLKKWPSNFSHFTSIGGCLNWPLGSVDREALKYFFQYIPIFQLFLSSAIWCHHLNREHINPSLKVEQFFRTFFDHFFGLFSNIFWNIFSEHFFEHFSNIFSDIFRTFFEHFSYIFRTFFEHFSNIFRTFFEHFPNIFRTFFEHFSNIFRTFFERFWPCCFRTKSYLCTWSTTYVHY